MSKLANLRRYLWLLGKFDNGSSLVRNLRSGGLLSDGPPLAEAVFKDGTRVLHPKNRSGLIGTLLEIWYENVYRIGEFYSPRKGDVIVDVGAHVGLFSIFLARMQAGCRIVSIEASTENFECLQQNTRSIANITAHNLALGSEPGWIKTTSDTGRSIDTRIVRLDHEEPGSTRILPVNELAGVVGSRQISLMKMDIEGAETEIFENIDDGMIASIEKLCMEYHDNLNPGTLELVESRLSPSHRVEVYPDEGTGHGMLFASLKAKPSDPAEGA